MAVGFDAFDEDKDRERLRAMSDEELIREGRGNALHLRNSTNFGEPPRRVYVSTLRLCKRRVALSY